MRLGISGALEHESVAEWAKKQSKLGCKSIVFPISCNESDELIDEYVKAARENDLMIAEVGIWRNALFGSEDEVKKNLDYCVNQLRLADYIGARCCVNVAGAIGSRWDGGYKENFSKETYEKIVKMVRYIIDTADVKNTYFTLEPMPWMIPTGPDEYLRLLEDVDRDRFAVHLDGINMINSSQRYFAMEEFIDECFEKLGKYIKSCHIKDIHLCDEYTLMLRECAPGMGEFPLKYYMEKIDKLDENMPIILEHLNSDEDYYKYFDYIKKL